MPDLTSRRPLALTPLSRGRVLARVPAPRPRAGFTLIEVLVVTVIVAILATLAYPSYERTIARTWRGQAIACLEELASGMEGRFYQAMSYRGRAPPVNACVRAGAGENTAWIVNDAALARRYAFAFAGEATATEFVLVATAQGRQAELDSACSELHIDQAGRRGSRRAAAGGSQPNLPVPGEPLPCW